MVACQVSVLLGCVFLGTGAITLDCNPSTTSDSATLRLNRKLLCDYDKDARPVENESDTVNVNVLLWLSFIKFFDTLNTLEIHCWTIWDWKDEFLTWNPADYEDVTEMRIKEDAIWVPDVGMSNGGGLNSPAMYIPTEPCYLRHDGSLHCAHPTVYEMHCVPELWRWPFDSQECYMRLASWVHHGGEINLTVNPDHAVSTVQLKSNQHWELLSVNHERETTTFSNMTFPAIRYQFLVRRRTSGFAAVVIIPALVLSVVMLASFWLDARGPQRLFLGGTNVFAYSVFLQFLGLMLPSNGDDCPFVVQFYRDSMLLAGVALVEAVLVRGVSKSSGEPPGWLQTGVLWLVNSRLGQILWLSQSDHVEEGKTGSEMVQVWALLGSLVDRLCFLVFSLTLAALAMRFIP